MPQASRVQVWVMDEARFGLHTEMRRVWISKGVRPEVRRQTRYEWGYLYGALEVVEGRAEFLHLPTVNRDCNQLFLEHLRSSDPQAHHVVIADQAGFHLREGDPRLPEGSILCPFNHTVLSSIPANNSGMFSKTRRAFPMDCLSR